MAKLPFTREEFQDIYSKVPRVCVDLIIHSDKGVLLIPRESDGWEGQWHYPGGTVYLHESIEMAVHRKAQEEVGADVDIEKPLGILEYFNVPMGEKSGHIVSHVFLCHLKDIDAKLNPKAQFFRELPGNIIPEQKKVLEEYWEEIMK